MLPRWLPRSGRFGVPSVPFLRVRPPAWPVSSARACGHPFTRAATVSYDDGRHMSVRTQITSAAVPAATLSRRRGRHMDAQPLLLYVELIDESGGRSWGSIQ